jgi:hypothetical protein
MVVIAGVGEVAVRTATAVGPDDVAEIAGTPTADHPPAE